jgi:Uma2 family endonuclease
MMLYHSNETKSKWGINMITEFENEEYQEMGSLNHSVIQARLAGSFFNDDKFTPAVELSLDISQLDLNQFAIKAKDELKPDVCLYESHLGLSKPDDILRMSKMPLLTIEILSPKQTIDDILNKFKAYFALNVQSCWLVIPILESITVYSQRIDNFKLFEAKGDTEVIDEGLDIRLPLQNIFK